MLIDPISAEYAAPYFIAAALAGYLLGSIPFGLVFTRMAGLGDIRSVGSGNIGATNVLRTGNRWIALATLVADAAKGAVAVLIARYVAGDTIAVIAGAGAFVGHIFPVWLRFKGGKGVATFLGLMLALHFLVGLACCATWLVVAAITRYSSLSALVAAVMAPVYLWLFAQWVAIPFTIGFVVLIFIRHRDNIRRLMAGEEPKIGAKKEAAAQADGSA